MPSPRRHKKHLEQGRRGDRPHTLSSPVTSLRVTSLAWKAPRFHFFRKSSLWTVVALASTITTAYGFFLFEYFALALIVLLGGLTVILLAQQRPEVAEHRIDRKGVWAGKHLFPWAILRSFWTVPHQGFDKLYLETTNRLRPQLTILFPRGKHLSIREELGKHLPEHPTRGEVFSETVARILRI